MGAFFTAHSHSPVVYAARPPARTRASFHFNFKRRRLPMLFPSTISFMVRPLPHPVATAAVTAWECEKDRNCDRDLDCDQDLDRDRDLDRDWDSDRDGKDRGRAVAGVLTAGAVHR
jgi:hypothetical protein